MVEGGVGSDLIFGGSDNDTLHGSAGIDAIAGDDGTDTVYGEEGNDLRVGGSDADVFVVVTGGGSDLILGFEIGIDRIDLSACGTTAMDEITVHDLANGHLLLRNDRVGGAEKVIIASTRMDDLSSDDILFS
ncbi:MAG: hypothetical protein AAF479_01280 [Pseudomonadota bacterium]